MTVTAKVTALVEITKGELLYKAGTEAEKTVPMTGMTNDAGVYQGTIPAAPVGTKVVYHIEASTDGNTECSPEVSYTVGEVPIDYTGLALNELNGNDKFIEIYNKGKEDIHIKGISIQKAISLAQAFPPKRLSRWNCSTLKAEVWTASIS